jgi:DNA repair protein RadC
MTNHTKSEAQPAYAPSKRERIEDVGDDANQALIDRALAVLKSRLRRPGRVMANPRDTANYLTLRFAEERVEMFSVLFLDNVHRLIEERVMFQGTINACSVYPREVVRVALGLNAAAVILAHNHPSGGTTPSEADRALTGRLVDALSLIDVTVLDHIIVGSTTTLSLAEHGLI